MKIPLQKITDSYIENSGVNLFILRLDLIHPTISGNKWYKLKYNLEEAKKQKKETLLTFGGAFSNHIAATAAAGKEFGFKTIGIIRGNELAHLQPFPSGREKSKTLKFAEECGMVLRFISREDYREKKIPDSLARHLSSIYILPEGGTNELAVKGCAEIISHIDIPFDYVCCPVATGGTIEGIASSLKENQQAIGFSVLKGIQISSTTKVLKTFVVEVAFGGYAKHTPELLKFISDFEKQNNDSTSLTTRISLEHVYTGKMMFGIYDLIKKKHFPENSTIVAIHTGGLQGKLPHPQSLPAAGKGD